MLKSNHNQKKKQSKQKTSVSNNNQSKLQKLIAKDPNFQFIQNGKIKCLVTGHEMLPSIQNYQTYLKSKSYKRGLQSQFDITQYEDIIISHKDLPNLLYCQLTKTKLPKKKSVLMKHIEGKKFKRRYQQYLKVMEGQQKDEQGSQEQFQFVDENESQQQDIEEQQQISDEQSQQQKIVKKDKKIQKNIENQTNKNKSKSKNGFVSKNNEINGKKKKK